MTQEVSPGYLRLSRLSCRTRGARLIVTLVAPFCSCSLQRPPSLAGTIAADVEVGPVHVRLIESGWRDALVTLGFLVGTVVYWGFCLMSFGQIKSSKTGKHALGND